MVINTNSIQGSNQDQKSEMKQKQDSPATRDSGSRQGGQKSKSESRPGAKMFQTTKINSSALTPHLSSHHQAQFKQNLNQVRVSQSGLLEHEFSRLKWDQDGRPDYRGFPDNISDDYTEEELDYHRVKLSLVVEGDTFTTRDRINTKESLKLLEINALQKLHEESTMAIDGFEIQERPEITLNNLNRLPAYQDWMKLLSLDKNVSLTDQSPRSCQNIGNIASDQKNTRHQHLGRNHLHLLRSESQRDLSQGSNSLSGPRVEITATQRDCVIRLEKHIVMPKSQHDHLSKYSQVSDGGIRNEAEPSLLGQKRNHHQMQMMEGQENSLNFKKGEDEDLSARLRIDASVNHQINCEENNIEEEAKASKRQRTNDQSEQPGCTQSITPQIKDETVEANQMSLRKIGAHSNLIAQGHQILGNQLQTAKPPLIGTPQHAMLNMRLQPGQQIEGLHNQKLHFGSYPIQAMSNENTLLRTQNTLVQGIRPQSQIIRTLDAKNQIVEMEVKNGDGLQDFMNHLNQDHGLNEERGVTQSRQSYLQTKGNQQIALQNGRISHYPQQQSYQVVRLPDGQTVLLNKQSHNANLNIIDQSVDQDYPQGYNQAITGHEEQIAILQNGEIATIINQNKQVHPQLVCIDNQLMVLQNPSQNEAQLSSMIAGPQAQNQNTQGFITVANQGLQSSAAHINDQIANQSQQFNPSNNLIKFTDQNDQESLMVASTIQDAQAFQAHQKHQAMNQHQQAVQVVQTNSGQYLVQPSQSQVQLYQSELNEQPIQVTPQQPQYQIATLNGQQVLIIPTSQTSLSQAQIQQQKEQQQTQQQLTYIQTPNGLVLTQAQPSGGFPQSVNHQHQSSKQESLSKMSQYIDENGRVLVYQPNPQIKDDQQYFEIDTLPPSNQQPMRQDTIVGNQNYQIVNSQGEVLAFQNSVGQQYMYDSVTGQPILVQTIPDAENSAQYATYYDNQGAAYIQPINQNQIQMRQQMQGFDTGAQFQANEATSYLPSQHQQEHSYRNNHHLPSHNHGGHNHQNGVCNNCNRHKPLGQGRMHSHGQRTHSQGFKRNEHTCHQPQPQIVVHQPYQVIKSNIYQTQYNTTNQVQIPESLVQIQGGNLIQEILPPTTQSHEYYQTVQYIDEYGQAQEYQQNALQEYQIPNDRNQNQINLGGYQSDYVLPQQQQHQQHQQQLAQTQNQLNLQNNNQFHQPSSFQTNQIINTALTQQNQPILKEGLAPLDPFKYSSKHSKESHHFGNTNQGLNSYNQKSFLKSNISKKHSSNYLLGGGGANSSHLGLKQNHNTNHESTYLNPHRSSRQLLEESMMQGVGSQNNSAQRRGAASNDTKLFQPLRQFSPNVNSSFQANQGNLKTFNFTNQSKFSADKSTNLGQQLNFQNNQRNFSPIQSTFNLGTRAAKSKPIPKISNQEMQGPIDILKFHGLNPQLQDELTIQQQVAQQRQSETDHLQNMNQQEMLQQQILNESIQLQQLTQQTTTGMQMQARQEQYDMQMQQQQQDQQILQMQEEIKLQQEQIQFQHNLVTQNAVQQDQQTQPQEHQTLQHQFQSSEISYSQLNNSQGFANLQQQNEQAQLSQSQIMHQQIINQAQSSSQNISQYQQLVGSHQNEGEGIQSMMMQNQIQPSEQHVQYSQPNPQILESNEQQQIQNYQNLQSSNQQVGQFSINLQNQSQLQQNYSDIGNLQNVGLQNQYPPPSLMGEQGIQNIGIGNNNSVVPQSQNQIAQQDFQVQSQSLNDQSQINYPQASTLDAQFLQREQDNLSIQQNTNSFNLNQMESNQLQSQQQQNTDQIDDDLKILRGNFTQSIITKFKENNQNKLPPQSNKLQNSQLPGAAHINQLKPQFLSSNISGSQNQQRQNLLRGEQSHCNFSPPRAKQSTGRLGKFNFNPTSQDSSVWQKQGITAGSQSFNQTNLPRLSNQRLVLQQNSTPGSSSSHLMSQRQSRNELSQQLELKQNIFSQTPRQQISNLIQREGLGISNSQNYYQSESQFEQNQGFGGQVKFKQHEMQQQSIDYQQQQQYFQNQADMDSHLQAQHQQIMGSSVPQQMNQIDMSLQLGSQQSNFDLLKAHQKQIQLQEQQQLELSQIQNQQQMYSMNQAQHINSEMSYSQNAQPYQATDRSQSIQMIESVQSQIQGSIQYASAEEQAYIQQQQIMQQQIDLANQSYLQQTQQQPQQNQTFLPYS